MFPDQAEPRFVGKTRDKLDPLRIVPKQCGLLEVDPVLAGVGFAFAWIILKLHIGIIYIPYRASSGGESGSPRAYSPWDMFRPEIKEHDGVILTEPFPVHGLEPGDIGPVVRIYADGEAYEAEFASLDGHTAAICTVEPSQFRPAWSCEIVRARELVAR